VFQAVFPADPQFFLDSGTDRIFGLNYWILMPRANRPYILTTILVLIVSMGFAQSDSQGSIRWYKDLERYIPKEDSPTFWIRLNFVIPQKSDGTGNFSADNPEHETQLRKSISLANDLWRDLKNPKNKLCYTGEDFVPSTYIQFYINAFIYIQDDYYWNAENGSGCPNDGNWYLNGLEKEIRENPAYDHAINIYLPNDSSDYKALILDRTLRSEPQSKPPCSELPTVKKLDRSSRICLSNAYNKFWFIRHIVPEEKAFNSELLTWEGGLVYWDYSGRGHSIGHELGHSMGLNHQNEYHRRNECEESIMNQRHGKPHNYLQPSEIGKMHANMRMSNIRDFLQEEVYVPTPIVIDKDETMDMDFKAYEDFLIKDGASLKVTENMSFPKEARIIIEPGGKLIIAHVMVSSRSKEENPPLILIQEKKSWFFTSKKKRKKGSIEFIGKGQILGSVEHQKVK